MKTCKTCGITKGLDQFHKSPKGVDGVRAHCKVCRSAKHREDYDPERQRRAMTKFRYGISVDEVDRMRAQQNHCCAICGIHEDDSSGRGKLHIDHCHETGKVRGLLCSNCNTALGKFQDSEDVLLNAIQYLRS